MPSEGFVTVVWPGTAQENSGGKRALPAGKSERAGERDFRFCVRESDFFFLIRVGFYGSLRANQLKKLVGALKIQPLLATVLRPASVDGRFGGVERAVINASHHGNFKVKTGVVLAHLDGGKSTYAHVWAIERSNELLAIVMRDMQLQAQAQAVAFERALPYSFGAGNSVGRFLCAGSRRLAMKNKRQADTALHPVTIDAALIRCQLSFVGSTHGSYTEAENCTFLGK